MWHSKIPLEFSVSLWERVFLYTPPDKSHASENKHGQEGLV